jgi:ribulose 1,5-bisphosphate synthetase/thiazole synthase
MMIKIDNNKAINVAVVGSGISAIMTAVELMKRNFRVTVYTDEKFKLLQMSNET